MHVLAVLLVDRLIDYKAEVTRVVTTERWPGAVDGSLSSAATSGRRAGRTCRRMPRQGAARSGRTVVRRWSPQGVDLCGATDGIDAVVTAATVARHGSPERSCMSAAEAEGGGPSAWSPICWSSSLHGWRRSSRRCRTDCAASTRLPR